MHVSQERKKLYLDSILIFIYVTNNKWIQDKLLCVSYWYYIESSRQRKRHAHWNGVLKSPSLLLCRTARHYCHRMYSQSNLCITNFIVTFPKGIHTRNFISQSFLFFHDFHQIADAILTDIYHSWFSTQSISDSIL